MRQVLRRVIRLKIVLLLFVLMIGKSWGAGGGPWSYGLEASTLYDDNIGRSQNEVDIEKDMLFSVALDGSYTWGLSELTALTLSGLLQMEEFYDFDGLSNTRYGLALDYRFQTRIGFTAPSYSTFVRVTQTDAETDIRDALTTEFGFRVTKRVTDIITGTLGFTATESEADGTVFDLERTRYFANADYRINNRWSAYLTYNFIDGDVFSTATPNLNTTLPWVDAFEPDNAFGGIANNKLAYRLDAKTSILRLGANVGINSSTAIDISVDMLDSDAAGPNEYDRLSAAVSFLYRFR